MQRTREAARDALGNPAYAGKTVVLTWEHKHIAHRKLEKDYPHEKVTLRQLLQLEEIKDVPDELAGGQPTISSGSSNTSRANRRRRGSG